MRVVPPGWSAAQVGDVCRIVSGATPSTAVSDYWGGDIVWVTPNDLSKDRSQIIHHGERTLAKKGYQSCSAQLFPAGSVIVSSRAPIGYVAIAGQEMCTNQGCKTAVPPSEIDSRYLYWFLVGAKRDMEQRASGTTFREISGKRFAETQLVWPGLHEQRRIAEIVEDHLSRLDAAATLAESSVTRLGALVQSQWDTEFGTGSPERMLPLLAVADIANGQTPKGLVDVLKAQPGAATVPYYKVGDMNASSGRHMSHARFHVGVTDAKELGLHVRGAGTVLIPKRGGAIATNKKRLLKGPAAYDLNTMGLVPSPSLLPEYLLHWLQGVDLGRLADGSNVPQINAPQIRGLVIPVPPLGTQVQVVARLDDAEESAARLRCEARIAIERAARLRQALLACAFAGRLTGRGGGSHV